MEHKIPKRIFQTRLTKPSGEEIHVIKNIFHGWTYENFREGDEIYQFFKDNPLEEFPDIIEKYNRFKGAHRSDIFRYYYLYINGGCYLDDDALPHTNIDYIIGDSEKEGVFIKSEFFKDVCDMIHIFNGFICIVPKHPIMYKALHHMYHMTTEEYLTKSKKHYQLFCEELYKIIYYDKDINRDNLKIYNETTKKQDKLNESVIMNKRNVKILTHYFNYKHLKTNKIPKDHELLSLLPIQELRHTYDGLISRIS